MTLRYDAKKDKNQTPIVEELRAGGFRVDIVHRLKKLYDLVVTGRTESGEVRTLRVEVKMPGETLSPDEQEYWDADNFHETLIIAYTADDVLRWFGRVV